MLKILNNPKTENYQLLKNIIFDHQFPWYYQATSTTGLSDMKGHRSYPFYSHIFLTRPDATNPHYYPVPKSGSTDLAVQVISEIINYNKNPFNDGKSRFFLTRLSSNSTFPIEDEYQFTIPHCDHDFPHINFICYLNEGYGGGRTFIEGYSPHEPVEDQCIIFSGKHYMELPKRKRRIIIVGTMINFE